MTKAVVVFEKDNFYGDIDYLGFDGKGTFKIIYDPEIASVTFVCAYKDSYTEVEFPVSIMTEIRSAVAQAKATYG